MPTPIQLRRSLPGALAAIAIAVAGCGGDDPFSSEQAAERTATPDVPSRAAPSEISEGTATLALSGSVTTLLNLAGVDIVPAPPATRTDNDIELPITSGSIGVDPLAGRLEHDGGIRFTGGTGTLEATDLHLDLRTGVATAEVGGARIPLLETDFQPPRLSEDGERVVIEGEDASVTDEAIAALNAMIGSEVVPAGLSIGDLTVEARWP